MSTSIQIPSASFLDDDQTVRWSCRSGEFALWVSTESPLTSHHLLGWSIRDFWQMRDGDFLTITNRSEDLPVWFDLHPREVANREVRKMSRRIDAGYSPREPMDGPNIWRAKAGDTLVLVTTRSLQSPVTEILVFRACVLVVGENANPSSAIFFGTPSGERATDTEAFAMRAGLEAVTAMGAPRTWSSEWRFGA
jgi:hypothetical protein